MLNKKGKSGNFVDNTRNITVKACFGVYIGTDAHIGTASLLVLCLFDFEHILEGGGECAFEFGLGYSHIGSLCF